MLLEYSYAARCVARRQGIGFWGMEIHVVSVDYPFSAVQFVYAIVYCVPDLAD